MPFDFQKLKTCLNRASKPMPPAGVHFEPASVFMLLFDEHRPSLLAIHKAENDGYPWSNQVALPGGHREAGDKDALDTAFRELEEELAITADQVTLLGSLGHFQTIRQKDVEVFVGVWNQKGPVRFDPREIARVLAIPLDDLFRTHRDGNFQGHVPAVDVLLYPCGDLMIWGLTARILHHFLELIHPLWADDGHGGQ